MQYTRFFFQVLLSACFLTCVKAGEPREWVVQTAEQKSYILAQNASDLWGLRGLDAGDPIWQDALFVEGAVTQVKVMLDGRRLLVAGLAMEEIWLKGLPLDPGPFMAVIHPEDGRLMGVTAMASDVIRFQLEVTHGVFSWTLVSEERVWIRQFTLEEVLFENERETQYIVDNGGGGSDPTGGSTGGDNNQSGGGSGGGSGSGGTGSTGQTNTEKTEGCCRIEQTLDGLERNPAPVFIVDNGGGGSDPTGGSTGGDNNHSGGGSGGSGGTGGTGGSGGTNNGATGSSL